MGDALAHRLHLDGRCTLDARCSLSCLLDAKLELFVFSTPATIWLGLSEGGVLVAVHSLNTMSAGPPRNSQPGPLADIHAGMRVVIVGLQRATEHNARIGLVGDAQPGGRWVVVLDHSTQTLKVKMENMKVHQAILPGTRVFVHGAQGDLARFNGRIGVVDKIRENATTDVLVQAFAEGNGPTTTLRGVPVCNLCLMSTELMVNMRAAKARGTSLKMKQSEMSETECKQTNVVIVRLPGHMNTNDLAPDDYTITSNSVLGIFNGKINGVLTQVFTNHDTDTADKLVEFAGQCKLVLAYDPCAKVATPCCMNPMCLQARSENLLKCLFCSMPRYCSRQCMEKDTIHRMNCWPGVDIHEIHNV